jgi:hypothetical protein
MRTDRYGEVNRHIFATSPCKRAINSVQKLQRVGDWLRDSIPDRDRNISHRHYIQTATETYLHPHPLPSMGMVHNALIFACMFLIRLHVVVLRYKDFSFGDYSLLGCYAKYIGTKVPIFRGNLLPPSSGQKSSWNWRQKIPLRFWYPFTELHNVISQKAVIIIITAVFTSNLSNLYSWTDFPTCFSKNMLTLDASH